MLSWIKGVHVAYKAGAAITGAAIVGGAFLWDCGTAPIRENAQAIEDNGVRIEAVEDSQADMKDDLQLVRCWALHEIEGTDASVCLMGNGDK